MMANQKLGYSEISAEAVDPPSRSPVPTAWGQWALTWGGILAAIVIAFHAGLFVGDRRSPVPPAAAPAAADGAARRFPSPPAGGDGTVGARAPGAVLVTGATGRTGSLLYRALRDRGVADVRAFVRDPDKARAVLGCDACDESEGIFVGDATRPEDLERAMRDGRAATLAIAVGGSPRLPPAGQREVEFDSVVHSVRALAASATRAGRGPGELRVVLCSSMGTNDPRPPSFFGDVLFWKLNAEAYLATSGIGDIVIVKPCGLAEEMAGGNSTLVVGHNGTIMEGTPYHTVSREDLAGLMAEAATMPSACNSNILRFDFCSRPGPATVDLGALIDSARWEWDNSLSCV